MVGNEDVLSSPLFVPQDSPGLRPGSDNNHSDTLFEDINLDMALEAPDVDMDDHVDDLEGFGNPESKFVKAGRSIFRLPEAGNNFLVGTQNSNPQERVAVEQNEDVEVRADPIVGRDLSFTSPPAFPPLTAHDFNLPPDAFSFSEPHITTEVNSRANYLPVVQPDEELLATQPHVTHEAESEVFPNFATDVGQLDFLFGQPDPYSDFATEANQRQFIIDQRNRDLGREVRHESPFSAQYPFGEPLPSLRSPMSEVQAAQAPAIEPEPVHSTLTSLGSQNSTSALLPSLQSMSEDQAASASIIEHEPAGSALSPSRSSNPISSPSLEPEPELEYRAAPPTIKRGPAASISPFTSRAERARRAAKRNAASFETPDQAPSTVNSMTSKKVASVRAHSDTPNKGTDVKEPTLPSSEGFTLAARTSERSGAPFGIKPQGTSATTSSSASAQAVQDHKGQTAIDKAFESLIASDYAKAQAAATLTRSQRRNNERNQKRDNKRNKKTNTGNNNIIPNNSSNITDHLSNCATTSSTNPTQPQNPPPASAESVIAAAYKHLDKQAQKYRDLENDACDREEELADFWTVARQLRVKAIEERRNALVVIRHRRRKLESLQGLSGEVILERGLMGLLKPLQVTDEPTAGSEEFEKMVIEGQKAGGQGDDGYETPPYGA